MEFYIYRASGKEGAPCEGAIYTENGWMIKFPHLYAFTLFVKQYEWISAHTNDDGSISIVIEDDDLPSY